VGFGKALSRGPFPKPGTLLALIQGATAPIITGPLPTAVRSEWQSLISGSVLQSACNAEVLNINQGFLKLRLGFAANNESNCTSINSFIGIGGGGTGRVDTFVFLPPLSAGNYCDDTSPGCDAVAKPAWVFLYVK
jgi:hypothetical protein